MHRNIILCAVLIFVESLAMHSEPSNQGGSLSSDMQEFLSMPGDEEKGCIEPGQFVKDTYGKELNEDSQATISTLLTRLSPAVFQTIAKGTGTRGGATAGEKSLQTGVLGSLFNALIGSGTDAAPEQDIKTNPASVADVSSLVHTILELTDSKQKQNENIKSKLVKSLSANAVIFAALVATNLITYYFSPHSQS